MSRNISLIPGELSGAAMTPASIVVIAALSVAIALLLMGVPWWVLRTRLTVERAAVTAVEARRTELLQAANIVERDLQAYRATVARATALRALLSQHRGWAPLFRLIESRTLPSVRYQGFTADVSGSVALPATAPSVRAAAEQLAAWQATDGVTGIEVSGLANTADELGVIRGARFDLRFHVDPATFSATGLAVPLSAGG